MKLSECGFAGDRDFLRIVVTLATKFLVSRHFTVNRNIRCQRGIP